MQLLAGHRTCQGRNGEMARKTACTRVEKKSIDEGTMARAVLAVLAVGMILGVLLST